MAAVSDVIEPCGCVPRQNEFVLAIAVVSEDFAIGIEIEVVRIAESVCGDFDLFEVRRESHECAGFGCADECAGRIDLAGGDVAVVATDEIPRAIGAFANGMAAMFAAFGFEQTFRWAVGLVIKIRIANSPDRSFTVENDVMTIETDPLCAAFGCGEQGCLIRFPVTIGVIEAFDVARPADDDAAKTVERHTLYVVREIVIGKDLNPESSR